MLSNGKVAKMPNKKLTDEKLIEIMQYKSKTGCDLCDIKNGNWCRTCNYDLMKSALDLINRLQAEKQNLEIELQAMRGAANSYKAENERLKNHIQEGIALAKQLPEMITLVKAEAYKECIEKVKEKSCKINMWHNDIVVKTDYQISGEALDNLLKEKVGEDNE